MKRILITSCLYMLIYAAFAQKDELKKMSLDFEQLLLTNQTFHLPYTITVASNMDTTVEHMDIDLYKSNDKDYLKMGKSQEVIHDGSLLLVVNHEARLMRMGIDTANAASNHVLISNFSAMIDSATSIQTHTKEGKLYYALAFSSSYPYASVEMMFSKKTKHLHHIDVRYSDAYPSEFRYIQIDYKEPDFTWVPEQDFPHTIKYVAKANGRYTVQDAYDGYKIY